MQVETTFVKNKQFIHLQFRVWIHSGCQKKQW